jgi:LAS superfamily LD-carboxypeptidase LdcB
MKLQALILTTLFAVAATNVIAQQRGTPEEMIQKRVDNIKKEVKLTADQEKKLAAIFLETLNKRDELFASRRGSGETREAAQEKFRQVKEDENAKIKKLLTAEQYKAYTSYLEKQQKEAEQRSKAQQQGTKK